MKDIIVSIAVGVGTATGVHLAAEASMFAPVHSSVLSLFGADVYALCMSIVGSLLAMGVAPPLTPRSKMWMFFLISTIAGATFAALMPFAPVIGDQLAKAPVAPIAFILSFISRWVIPVAIEEVPKLVKRKLNGE